MRSGPAPSAEARAPGLRLAMWSGPRNISTAMMRAWGNRPDTAVCDEPLYAFYLLRTGAPHPGREEVIARHETDWRRVIAGLCGPPPEGKVLFYQKHMAHHLLPEVDREWLDHLTHAFLIRDPGQMLASLLKHLSGPRLEDTGLPQQVEIFESVRRRSGVAPPVIDARDVLENPRGMLQRLCEALGVEFLETMLAWAPGPRATDGVWAKHWYAEVERTTGFQPYRPKAEALPARFAELLERCRELYARLHEARLLPE